jgi:hypothetical protein
MTSFTRTALTDFDFGIPLYAGATVSAWTVDTFGNKTAFLATLYADLTSTAVLSNPQTLDGFGKWSQPIYIDAPVILTVTGANGVPDHQTGVISANLAGSAATDAAASAASAAGYFGSVADTFARIRSIYTKVKTQLLPVSLTALSMLRVKADGSAYELRSPSQVLSDIAAAGTAIANTFTKAINLAKAANVASATSCNIWTPADGNLVHITGTTTIVNFATAPQAGATRRVVFDGALTLTNNANIVIPGGQSITTTAGDVADITADTTTKVLVNLVKSAWPAGGGKIAQIVNTETGAVATGTTVIPNDDTIPQNTEGDQYMSLAITPISATSTLYIDVCWLGSSSVVGAFIAALFQDSTANALAAVKIQARTIGDNYEITFRHKMTSGTTSATTFKVRVGNGNAGTTTFNGDTGARILGGAMASSITITEVLS